MPSLNVAAYIRECIESVVNQSLKEIEIICVDAGSTDGTLEILQEYAKKDERVRIINFPVKSYGFQMNLGIDTAQGDYIGIVETDDFVEPDMFELLLKAAEESGADVTKCDYYKYKSKPFPYNIPANNLKLLDKNVCFRIRRQPALMSRHPSIWCGLYKKSFLTKKEIRFVESPGASFQDNAFIMKCEMAADNIYLIGNYLYHYRTDNEGSSVKNKSKIYCICDEVNSAVEYLNSKCEYKEECADIVYAQCARACFRNYNRLDNEGRELFAKRMSEYFTGVLGGHLLGNKHLYRTEINNAKMVIRNYHDFYEKNRVECEENNQLDDYIKLFKEYFDNRDKLNHETGKEAKMVNQMVEAIKNMPFRFIQDLRRLSFYDDEIQEIFETTLSHAIDQSAQEKKSSKGFVKRMIACINDNGLKYTVARIGEQLRIVLWEG